MQKILEIPGDFRIRISSIEPDGFGKEFIDLFQHPKLAPHLHLCLQSGSEQILLKMRRMYNIDSYLELISSIKSQYPDFNLTTDIMVGFPGETDQHFAESCNIVKQIGFSHVHTFKYSIRDHTTAARMQNQVDEKTKQSRSEQIRELSHQNKLAYYQQFIGKNQQVLVEKRIDNRWFGYGEHYIPIVFESDEDLHNQFVSVKITAVEGDEKPVLKGQITDKNMIFEYQKLKVVNN